MIADRGDLYRKNEGSQKELLCTHIVNVYDGNIEDGQQIKQKSNDFWGGSAMIPVTLEQPSGVAGLCGNALYSSSRLQKHNVFFPHRQIPLVGLMTAMSPGAIAVFDPVGQPPVCLTVSVSRSNLGLVARFFQFPSWAKEKSNKADIRRRRRPVEAATTTKGAIKSVRIADRWASAGRVNAFNAPVPRPKICVSWSHRKSKSDHHQKLYRPTLFNFPMEFQALSLLHFFFASNSDLFPTAASRIVTMTLSQAVR